MIESEKKIYCGFSFFTCQTCERAIIIVVTGSQSQNWCLIQFINHRKSRITNRANESIRKLHSLNIITCRWLFMHWTESCIWLPATISEYRIAYHMHFTLTPAYLPACMLCDHHHHHHHGEPSEHADEKLNHHRRWPSTAISFLREGKDWDNNKISSNSSMYVSCMTSFKWQCGKAYAQRPCRPSAQVFFSLIHGKAKAIFIF